MFIDAAGPNGFLFAGNDGCPKEVGCEEVGRCSNTFRGWVMPDAAGAPWADGVPCADPNGDGVVVWPKAELDGRPKVDVGWPNVVGGRPNAEGCPNDEGCPNVEVDLPNEDCG